MKRTRDGHYVVGDSAVSSGDIIIQDSCGRYCIIDKFMIEELITDLAEIELQPLEDKVDPTKSFKENGR